MNRVTIDDLVHAAGIGKRTAIRLVREDKLPGFMDGRAYICSPGEFQKWLDGDLVPIKGRSTPAHITKRKPVEIVRIKGKAA